VGALAAPPYDVIDEDRQVALEASHPHNAVRLILPRDGDDGRDRYELASELFETWRRQGTLRVDRVPTFYLYRMTFDDDGRRRHTHGVIGALALPPPGEHSSPAVLPHERTMARVKSDRLALLRATRANFDPIWGLSLATGLTGLVDTPGTALARGVDHEGVEHALYALTHAERLEAVSAAVESAPIVLADGHHRFETACAYRDERLAASVIDEGASRIMAYIVELADDELCVRPIHRLLNRVGDVDVRRRLAAAFTIVNAGPNTADGVVALRDRMEHEAGLGLVDRTGLALLRPRDDALAPRLATLPPTVREVDSARFDVGVLPALPEAEVSYRNDTAAVAALVEKGVADAAVLLRPVTVSQIRAAALAGARMPEKTTFFHPKPRAGMVFRCLDDG
jgi:uncharacterized protein (DUF1015 family)